MESWSHGVMELWGDGVMERRETPKRQTLKVERSAPV
jgi:hypothetical protein